MLGMHVDAARTGGGTRRSRVFAGATWSRHRKHGQVTTFGANGWTSEERSSAGQFRQRSNRSRRVGEHPISDLDRHKKQESRLEGLAATIALRLFAAVDWRAEPTWAVRSRICRRTEPSKWSSLGFAPHRDRGLKENTGRSAAKTS